MKFADNKIVSNSGSDIEIILSPVVNEDGSIDLVESGKKNLQEEIQSYAESCDINVILQRVAQGETELLQRNKPMYGDFLDMPKTYAEMLQLQINSRNLFDSLPADVKSKFDNDVNKFFVSAGTNEWLEKCGYTIPEDTKSEFEKKTADIEKGE